MSGTPYQAVFNNSNANLHPAGQHEDARDTQYYTPETQPLELHHDDLPAGAGAPRFMGAAAQYDGNRASYASSQNSIPTVVGDEYDGQKGRGFYGMNYDESEYASQAALGGPKASAEGSPYLQQRNAYNAPAKSRKKIIIGSLIALAVIAIGVVVALYFTVIKPKNKNSTSNNTASGASNNGSSNDNGSTSSSPSSLVAVSGGDGSTVTMFDGSTFTYTNSLGGTWYYDPANPTASGARPNSWTPALNETFQFGVDPIRGCVRTSRMLT